MTQPDINTMILINKPW